MLKDADYFNPKEMLAIEMGEYYNVFARAQVGQKVDGAGGFFKGLYKIPDF